MVMALISDRSLPADHRRVRLAVSRLDTDRTSSHPHGDGKTWSRINQSSHENPEKSDARKSILVAEPRDIMSLAEPGID
jgi:hypothetical protein